MSRLKDEVIEDASKLGEIIDLCKDEIEQFNKHKQSPHFDRGDSNHSLLFGRKELADSILKILGLLPE